MARTIGKNSCHVSRLLAIISEEAFNFVLTVCKRVSKQTQLAALVWEQKNQKLTRNQKLLLQQKSTFGWSKQNFALSNCTVSLS